MNSRDVMKPRIGDRVRLRTDHLNTRRRVRRVRWAGFGYEVMLASSNGKYSPLEEWLPVASITPVSVRL